MDIKDLLIDKLEKYIDLLEEDLSDAAGIAWLHGWGSPHERIEKGEMLRESIKTFKKLKEDAYGTK